MPGDFLTDLLFLFAVVHGWPEGTFGLPMPKTGCPVGAVVDWETGNKTKRAFLGCWYACLPLSESVM